MKAIARAVSWVWLGLFSSCQALPGDRASESRPTVDLSGDWEFRMDPEDRGLRERWFGEGVPFERKIAVPGAWNAQGVGYSSEEQLRAYEAIHSNGSNLPGTERESDKLKSVFPGPAWYRRTLEIPASWSGRSPWIVFGGVHRTAEVWVNGEEAGGHRSYVTPMEIDLSAWARPGEKLALVVRVDARRRKDTDPLMGCLDTLDFLYLSWGGIYRPVWLEARGPAWIRRVYVEPRLAEEAVDLEVTFGGHPNPACRVELEVRDPEGSLVARGETRDKLRLPIPGARRWSPGSPTLYTLLARLEGQDAWSTRFGMREFKVEGGRFILNGDPIFLRGYGDDCIFPNTLCPPSGKEEFRRRLKTAREFGFNFVRHHSWMPPDEYLDVADELGMMLQPEFPIAYRWDVAATPQAKKVYLEEWPESIRQRRNHPSIIAWCMGNELYDSFDLAPEMYRLAKDADPTRPVIDSDGCGFKHASRRTLDYMVVQFGEGGSIGYQDSKYSVPASLQKPVIGHEMGYFVTLPDLGQISLFEGGLRPYWLHSTRDLAIQRGVSALYPQWLEASYRLQALCLKTNMEAARRSRLSGTSVWLFQDYPNCAEGVVDMFFRRKALSPEEFRVFNAPTVLLFEAPRRCFFFREAVRVKILASRFEDKAADHAKLLWELRSGKETLLRGQKEPLQVSNQGVQELAALDLEIPVRPQAEKLTFSAQLTDENGITRNEWSLWAYPEMGFPRTPDRVEVLTQLDADSIDRLEHGGRILLIRPERVFKTESTNFRLSSWDGGGPSGTLMDRNHPALEGVPNEGWGDLQFYPLIQGSQTVFLDELPAEVTPIIRCIDRPQRLANRAYLFEVSVGKGRLFVSGFNHAGALKLKDPGSLFFLDRLYRYAEGPRLAPAAELSPDWLRTRLRK